MKREKVGNRNDNGNDRAKGKIEVVDDGLIITIPSSSSLGIKKYLFKGFKNEHELRACLKRRGLDRKDWFNTENSNDDENGDNRAKEKDTPWEGLSRLIYEETWMRNVKKGGSKESTGRRKTNRECAGKSKSRAEDQGEWDMNL